MLTITHVKCGVNNSHSFDSHLHSTDRKVYQEIQHLRETVNCQIIYNFNTGWITAWVERSSIKYCKAARHTNTNAAPIELCMHEYVSVCKKGRVRAKHINLDYQYKK